MMPLPPRYLLPVPLPTPFRPGDPRHLDPLGLHVRDTTDPHKVRDRLVDIGVLRKNGDGTYSPYLPLKADLVNGKVPASQLPENQQGVTEVLVDGVSVVSSGTASINLTGKVDKEQGKGLSSNDYTAGEKQKLTGIEAGAQKNVTPVAPSTDASAAGKPADAKVTGDALAAKQPTISDLATIRAGAAAGASAVQPAALTAYRAASAQDAIDGAQNTAIAGKYTKPATGIPVTDLADDAVAELEEYSNTVFLLARVGASSIFVQVEMPTLRSLRYRQGETITASAQLSDRTGNRVIPLGTNTENIVLTFPGAVEGYLRDFLVLVTNTTGNTGNITFAPPPGAVVYGDGFTHSPASGETWLYSITEEAANVFWCKSEKMDVAQ